MGKLTKKLETPIKIFVVKPASPSNDKDWFGGLLFIIFFIFHSKKV